MDTGSLEHALLTCVAQHNMYKLVPGPGEVSIATEQLCTAATTLFQLLKVRLSIPGSWCIR